MGCDRSADADVMGLGVRLGFYFQLVASMVNAARGEGSTKEIAVMLAYTLCILGAGLNKLRTDAIQDVEFLALGTLIPVGLLVQMIIIELAQLVAAVEHVKSHPGATEEQISSTPPVKLIQVAVAMLTAAATVMLIWLAGYGGYNSLKPVGCPVVRFPLIFGSVSMADAAFRKALLAVLWVQAVLQAAYPLVMWAEAMQPAWLAKISMKSAKVQDDVADDDDPQSAIMRSLQRRVKKQLGVGVSVLFVCILQVELVFRFNHFSGLNSVGGTGQIIPLVVGLMTAVQCAWGGANIVQINGGEEGEGLRLVTAAAPGPEAAQITNGA